ncbi:type II secretion system protein GspL [Pseudoxanthomonas sp. SGNA-20]|nr:type II secretion system protein GspL [Pseudoxanthomonas sp. SGNA-20]
MMKPPSATRLTLLARDPAQPSTCLRIDPSGRILARQPLLPGQAPPPPPGESVREVVAVPGESVRLLWLELPARHPAQALAAARLQLEDHVAGAVEGLHVAIAPAAAGPRLLGAVEDATLRGWLQRCAQLGISPHAVVPDCLLLPEADDGTLLAAPAGDMLAVRGPRLAFTAEPGLARAIAGARPLRMLEPGEAEARFAAAAAGEPPLDLLQYGHARRDPRARRRRRRLAVLAALALCSPVLVDGALALRYALGAHWMQARADALAVQQVPALAASADPSAALHALHAELAAPAVLAQHSAALFGALPAVPGAQLDSYEFATATGVRAGLLHAGEQDLETLRERLAPAGLAPVPLESRPVDGGMRSLVGVEALR